MLDEIVFKCEGFAFVADKNGFEVGNFAGKRAGLGIDPTGFEKIRTDPTTKRGKRYTPGFSGRVAAFSRGSID